MISAGKLLLTMTVVAASMLMTGCTIDNPDPLLRAKGQYVCKDAGGPYEYARNLLVLPYVICNNGEALGIHRIKIEDPKYFNTEPAPDAEPPNEVKI